MLTHMQLLLLSPMNPSKNSNQGHAPSLSRWILYWGYFQTMMDEDLLALESRKNKAPGGYSLGLHVAHRPFIFMSNTNTTMDLGTILHEGGHAFHEFERAHVHFYQRGENYLPQEFGEVASMGMELLASPYLTKACGGFYTES